MKKLLLSVTEPLDVWLREESVRLGISMSELVRRVLDAARIRSEKKK